MKLIIAPIAAALFSIAGHATPTDGQLDPNFAIGGKRTFSFTAAGTTTDTLNTILLRSDAKIFLVGIATPSGIGDGKIAIARLLKDGTPDADFGANGLLTLDPRPTEAEVFSRAVIDSSDRILIVGSVVDSTANKSLAMVCRILSTGVMDTTYGSDGDGCATVPFPNSQYAEFRGGALQPNGSLIAVGLNILANNQNRGIFARLTDSGTLDTTFGNAGITGFGCGTTGGCALNAAAVGPGGRVVGVGTVYEDDASQKLVTLALTSAGVLDTTFNSNGSAQISLGIVQGVETDVANAATFGNSGRLAVTGYALVNNELAGKAAVVEFANNGSQNYQTTFYLGASVAEISQAAASAYQEDGKLIVVGGTILTSGADTQLAVTRLLPGGALDTDFGNGEGQLVDFDAVVRNNFGSSVVLQSNQILIGGNAYGTNGADSIFGVTRLTTDLIFANGLE